MGCSCIGQVISIFITLISLIPFLMSLLFFTSPILFCNDQDSSDDDRLLEDYTIAELYGDAENCNDVQPRKGNGSGKTEISDEDIQIFQLYRKVRAIEHLDRLKSEGLYKSAYLNRVRIKWLKQIDKNKDLDPWLDSSKNK